MRPVRLTLRREAIAELTAEDLGGVHGAVQAITVQGSTCPLLECLLPPRTGYSAFDCITRSPACV